MHESGHGSSLYLRRSERRTFREAVINFLAAVTVNAAIVMSVPRSTAIDPVPMVLQRRLHLIDGRWREGEYLDGNPPSVVLVDLDIASPPGQRTGLITDN